jgi:Tfp pilus assembly protein PilW
MIRSKKAFSILELMIIIMVISLVLAAGVMPFIMQQKLMRQQMDRSKLQDDVCLALMYMTKDAYLAESLNVTTVNSFTVVIPTNTAGTTKNRVIYTWNNDASTITRQVDTYAAGVWANGTASTLVSNITGFSRSNTGNNYLSLSITGTKGSDTVTFDTGVALRATSA